MAVEQKVRSTYEHLLKLTDYPAFKNTLKFLREKEVVHYQRFCEALRIVEEYMQCKKIF